MRTTLKLKIDTEAGSRAIADGTMTDVMQQALERLRPEAAYFAPQDGVRTAFIVFDLEDPSQIPSISEPLFSKLNARIELFPVMDREDLQKGLAQIGGSAGAG